MGFKLRLGGDYHATGKGAAGGAAGTAVVPHQAALRLNRHWALRVNWKILSPVGLALLVWSLVLAVVVSSLWLWR